MGDLDRWLTDGLADQGSPSVLYHAQATVEACGKIEDCPFGNEAPLAQKRWQRMFLISADASAKRLQRAIGFELF